MSKFNLKSLLVFVLTVFAFLLFSREVHAAPGAVCGKNPDAVAVLPTPCPAGWEDNSLVSCTSTCGSEDTWSAAPCASSEKCVLPAAVINTPWPLPDYVSNLFVARGTCVLSNDCGSDGGQPCDQNLGELACRDDGHRCIPVGHPTGPVYECTVPDYSCLGKAGNNRACAYGDTCGSGFCSPQGKCFGKALNASCTDGCQCDSGSCIGGKCYDIKCNSKGPEELCVDPCECKTTGYECKARPGTTVGTFCLPQTGCIGDGLRCVQGSDPANHDGCCGSNFCEVSPNPDAGGDTVCGAGGYTQDDCLTDDDCATGFCDPISKQCKIYEPGGASCTNVGACCDEGNICVDFGGVLSCQRSNSCDSQSDHGTSAIPLPGYSGPKLTIEQILGAVSGLLFPIGLALGLFFIVKAGYTYMTSQGNPEMTKKAQEDLTAAIVGIVFILLSVTILRVIMKSVIGI